MENELQFGPKQASSRNYFYLKNQGNFAIRYVLITALFSKPHFKNNLV